MKDQISNRDWETISAYLDGQLPPQKRARFEARLQQEHHLYAALTELQNTRNVLRKTPRLRAPRNFTLTPQMVGQKAHSPYLASVFGWASAVASLLLVLVFVGDIFSAGGVIPVAVEGSADQAAYLDARTDVMPETGAMDMSEEPDEAESDYANASEGVADTGVPEGGLTPPTDAEPAAIPASPTQELEMVMAEDAPEATAPEPSMDAARSVESEEATILAVTAEDVEDHIIETDIEVGTDTFVISESAVITGAHVPAVDTEVVDDSVAASQADATMAKSGDELAEEEPVPDWQPQDSIETLEPNPTQEMALAIAEEGPQEEYAGARESNYILGIEVILALFILASGIAWIYLRYRGG